MSDFSFARGGFPFDSVRKGIGEAAAWRSVIYFSLRRGSSVETH